MANNAFIYNHSVLCILILTCMYIIHVVACFSDEPLTFLTTLPDLVLLLNYNVIKQTMLMVLQVGGSWQITSKEVYIGMAYMH